MNKNISDSWCEVLQQLILVDEDEICCRPFQILNRVDFSPSSALMALVQATVLEWDSALVLT